MTRTETMFWALNEFESYVEDVRQRCRTASNKLADMVVSPDYSADDVRYQAHLYTVSDSWRIAALEFDLLITDVRETVCTGDAVSILDAFDRFFAAYSVMKTCEHLYTDLLAQVHHENVQAG